MSHFLSRLHADIRGTLKSKRGATHKADDVPRGTHKSYERMVRLMLPEPAEIPTTLADVLQSRSSSFGGDPGVSLSLADAGTLFGLALRKRSDSPSRNYPSGGALYPVETYLISKAIEGQTPGAYHYNPSAHALERLWDIPADFDMKSIAPYPSELPLSSLIVFTSVWRRSAMKYGDLAYQHALIEAGHMSENVLLVATALGLRTRPYAGFQDEIIASILDLDTGEEQPVHSITLCAA